MAEVYLSGPVFDGRAAQDSQALFDDVQREVAEYAEFQWQMNMHDAFREPTGRYQSTVNIARREADLVVNDGWPGSGVVYGPWLEGVGSRNETTRFKGYWSLRRASNSVVQKVKAIADPIVERFIEKTNGE